MGPPHPPAGAFPHAFPLPPPSNIPQLAKPHDHNAVKSVVLSIPTRLRPSRIINLTINALLLLCVGDMVASPVIDPATEVAFARTGAVYEDGANIAVRYPQENATEGAVRVLWRKTDDEQSPAWIKGPLVHVTASTLR